MIPSKMTTKQATAEAKRRWGLKAAALEYLGGPSRWGRFRVYANIYGDPVGSGTSFEEAFADADRNGK